MLVAMRILRLNHSVYQLEYHVVWGTKYRMKLLQPYVKEKLLSSFQKTEFLYPTLHIVKVNTAKDHVHLLVEIAPSVSIAAMVQKLKAHSSMELKRSFKFIREADDGSGIWSIGYFASSVGLNEKMIEGYISNQDKHDRPKNARLGFS
jgi:putative transposase